METATLTAQETVKLMYDAFGVGNIPLVLEQLGENFTWQDPCDPAIIPYGGKFHGKSGMTDFFNGLGGSTDTILWEVNDYVSEDNKVVALGKHGIRCKKTGKEAFVDWAMIWHFENDMPVSGQAYYNTAAVEKAFS
jgi:ketosteroid isomerase-like protein